MVDPKMLELSIYEGIPQLLLPVVTDPKKANLALRWAVDEMERRYELLAKSGVRDITGYNRKVEKILADADAKQAALAPDEVLIPDRTNPSDAEKEGPPTKLPYIVIVIDEFADLMMVAPKDVETSVARIAQKARAAGLHLILATQRPSVDVLTGLIKANFPSRVALQVASKIDSRTIFDQPGPTPCWGMATCCFRIAAPNFGDCMGPSCLMTRFIGSLTISRRRRNPSTTWTSSSLEDDGDAGAAGKKTDFSDPLYDQAVAIVCDTRQASVSFVQRRLQIGYNRAARLVEQMEADGVVGPANGMKPREILAPQGEYLSNPTA